MKKMIILIMLLSIVRIHAQNNDEKLRYHIIRTDSSGKILPWYSNSVSESFDHVINIVWSFWDNMRIDYNGIPYYMNHQVWKKGFNDPRGIGGDQLSMALSSWRLLYAYSGNQRVLDNMMFLADYYLSHSLSSANCNWPNIPYPYNVLTYSSVYDGDMILGEQFTQPDKAGSFGCELINMYKLTGRERYLNAAEKIANTLSSNIKKGDNNHSPLPFRVNAVTGKVGITNEGTGAEVVHAYTSNWTGTMTLFSELISLKRGSTKAYEKSFQILLTWMKNYPLKTNKWGPFFEDVGEWSDTQINATTFAQYILNNPQLFPNWKEDARHVLDWVYKELGNKTWEKFGVTVANEQTAYRVAGNSHTSRQGAAELLYAAKTNDMTNKDLGIRQLIWATYMVNDDGESTYPSGVTWLTDGYGDFVRHYLRAMESFPELAPVNQNHLLKSSSVLRKIKYDYEKIEYETFDNTSTEVFRLTSRPYSVTVNNTLVKEDGNNTENDSWSWKSLDSGGLLSIIHKTSNKIIIKFWK